MNSFFFKLWIICLIGLPAQAQMNKTNTWEVSASYAPLIASTVLGVSEVVPTYGLKIAKGMSYYRPELFYHTGITSENPLNTIEYELLGISMKNPVDIGVIDEMPELKPSILVGLQYSKYETTTVGVQTGKGFHMGFALDYAISSGVQWTTDFLFCNGHGRFLVVNFGFQYEFGEENSKK